MNTHTILQKLGLGRRESAELLATPTARQILVELENTGLAERQRLLAELATAEAAHPAELQALEDEANTKQRAFDKAEAAYMAARSARDTACTRASGCATAMQGRRQAVHRSLRETADPRLEVYAHNLRLVIDLELKMALRYWVDASAARKGLPTGRSNVIECAAGRAAAEAALAEVAAMQIQPLPAAEVTTRLLALNAQLAKSLAPAEVNAPAMTDRAEAGKPEPWRGYVQWHAESVRVFGFDDLREADRTAATH